MGSGGIELMTDSKRFFGDEETGKEPRFIYPVYDSGAAVLPIAAPSPFIVLSHDVLSRHGVWKRAQKMRRRK